jgi:hypothetical protein
VLKHCAANRKRRLSALPNVDPYIYDVQNFWLYKELHICGVSKTFGEWYQKTNKTEDTNKLTLLTFKIIILQNTRLETFIKLLETVNKRPLKESIAVPLSHVVGLAPHGGNPTTCDKH